MHSATTVPENYQTNNADKVTNQIHPENLFKMTNLS